MTRISYIAAVLVLGLTSSSTWAAGTEKDTCLLNGVNCPPAADSLPEKIGKLEREIKKGRTVYSEEELTKLERKLREAKDILRMLMRPGD